MAHLLLLLRAGNTDAVTRELVKSITGDLEQSAPASNANRDVNHVLAKIMSMKKPSTNDIHSFNSFLMHNYWTAVIRVAKTLAWDGPQHAALAEMVANLTEGTVWAAPQVVRPLPFCSILDASVRQPANFFPVLHSR